MLNNKGISLITLVVTIIVMLILASIVYSSGFQSVEETTETKIAVERKKIMEAVSKRMVDNARNPSAYPLIGKKVEDIVGYAYYIDGMTNSELQDFIESVTEETIDYMRVVDSISAATLGVNGVPETSYYIVDYYTGKVYGSINMTAYNASTEEIINDDRASDSEINAGVEIDGTVE